MFAGHDTTATSFSFSLYLLATHPDIQQKCQKELDTIFGDTDRPVTVDDLSKMKYLESCIRESLRLYQSVPWILRKTGEELILDGYKIPAGTNVWLLFSVMHRDNKIFNNPD